MKLDNVIAQHQDVAEVVFSAIDDDIYDQNVGCAIKCEEGEATNVVSLKKGIEERVAGHEVPRKFSALMGLIRSANLKADLKIGLVSR